MGVIDIAGIYSKKYNERLDFRIENFELLENTIDNMSPSLAEFIYLVW